MCGKHQRTISEQPRDASKHVFSPCFKRLYIPDPLLGLLFNRATYYLALKEVLTKLGAGSSHHLSRSQWQNTWGVRMQR